MLFSAYACMKGARHISKIETWRYLWCDLVTLDEVILHEDLPQNVCWIVHDLLVLLSWRNVRHTVGSKTVSTCFPQVSTKK